MIARMLVPAIDDTERGALARVERLERRIGVASADDPAGADGAAPPPASAGQAAPSAAPATRPTEAAATEVTTQQVRDAWPQILDVVQKAKMSAWLVIFTAHVRGLRDDVLTLSFPSENDVASFRQQTGASQGVSECLRQAILDVLGIRVKFIAKADGEAARAAAERPSGAASSTPAESPVPESPLSSSVDAPDARPAAARTSPASTSAAHGSVAPASAAPASAPPTTAPPAAQPAAAPPRKQTEKRAGKQADKQTGSDPAARMGTATGKEPSSDGPMVNWPTVAIPGNDPRNQLASSQEDVPPPSDEDAPPEFEPPREPTYPEATAVSETPDASSRVSGANDAAPQTRGDARDARDPAPASARSDAAPRTATVAFQESQRYGEAVVREILGARFIEEQPASRGEVR